MPSVRDGVVAVLPAGQRQLSRLGYHVKRGVARVDNAEVRAARRLLRLLRSAPPDVLYLGDSLSSFTAPYDEDRRPLHRMISDALPAGTSMHTMHGGSYHPGLYSQFVRLVAASPARPVVLMSLAVRIRTVPWIEHPVYGHRRAIAFLEGVDPAGPLRAVRAGFPRPGPEEFEALYRLPHPTWAGETVGDHVRRLKGAPDGEDQVALLYAYHHGGVVAGLDTVTDVGRRLRDLGVPVVAYHPSIPVEHGTLLWGERFRELAADNQRRVEHAFREGAGPDAVVLQGGLDLPTAEFIDPADGSEHLNAAGRRRLADRIAPAVLAALDEQRSDRGAARPPGAAQPPGRPRA